MSRSWMFAAVAAVVATASVYGAAYGAPTRSAVPLTGKALNKKVAMVIAQGGLGDKSYNDLANTGLKRAEAKFGFKGQRIQSADIVSQGEAILRQACQAKFDLVIDLEFSTSDALQKVAPDCSRTQWTFLNLPLKKKNITSFVFAEHQGSYLAGALAALVTRDTKIRGINAKHVIGVIGGTKSTGIDKFLVGYYQGARSIDPKIKVLVKYSNNFGDPAKGKQITEAMYDQGADTDQSRLAPKYVLTSMVKRTDLAVYKSVQMLAAGKLGNKVVNLDLRAGGVGLGKIQASVPKQFVARVNKLKRGIITKKIKVWNVITQGYPRWFK
jgi:basic membrane protein A